MKPMNGYSEPSKKSVPSKRFSYHQCKLIRNHTYLISPVLRLNPLQSHLAIEGQRWERGKITIERNGNQCLHHWLIDSPKAKVLPLVFTTALVLPPWPLPLRIRQLYRTQSVQAALRLRSRRLGPFFRSRNVSRKHSRLQSHVAFRKPIPSKRK